MVCFAILGDALARQAQTLVLSEQWELALDFLKQSLDGITLDQAVAILAGDAVLRGRDLVEIVDGEDLTAEDILVLEDYRRELLEIYEGVCRANGRWGRAHGVIAKVKYERFARLGQHYGEIRNQVTRGGVYHADDMIFNVDFLVARAGKPAVAQFLQNSFCVADEFVDFMALPPGLAHPFHPTTTLVAVLFKNCDPPPFWLVPKLPRALEDAVGPMLSAGYLSDQGDLPPVAKGNGFTDRADLHDGQEDSRVTGYGTPDLSLGLAPAASGETIPSNDCAASSASTTPSIAASLPVSSSSSQASASSPSAQTSEWRSGAVLSAPATTPAGPWLGNLTPQIMASEALKALSSRIRAQAQDHGGFFDLTWTRPSDGAPVSLSIPQAPFTIWACGVGAVRGRNALPADHPAQAWKCVCPPDLKMQLDIQAHSDWLVGAEPAINPMRWYDRDADARAFHDAALAKVTSIQNEILGRTVPVMTGSGRRIALVEHPLKDGEATPGSILVIPHCGPEYFVPAIAAGKDGRTFIIAERGGAMSHLAVVGLEHGFTILIDPKARTKYPAGSLVDADADAGTIELLDVLDDPKAP